MRRPIIGPIQFYKDVDPFAGWSEEPDGWRPSLLDELLLAYTDARVRKDAEQTAIYARLIDEACLNLRSQT